VDVQRRGRSLIIAGQHYRFLTPHETAQAANHIRKLPPGISTYQVDLIIKRYKGKKVV